MTTEFMMADLAAHIGEELGTSDWIVITQPMVDAFADIMNDRAWIHNDPEKAKRGPFGSPVVQGLLSLSLVPPFAANAFRVTDASINVNYGYNKVRFPSVVPVGGRVRGVFRLVDAQTIGDDVRVTLAAVVEVEGGERPALVAEQIFQFQR